MFTDISPLLLKNPRQENYGIAITDMDGDGHFEAFVAGFGHSNLVLKWDDGGFVDVANAALADPRRQSIGLAAADIDGDGREEVYVLNSDSFDGPKRYGDRLLSFDGHAWSDLFGLDENLGVVNMVAGRSVACVDRSGTGRYGFVVACYGGPLLLYEWHPALARLENVAEDAGIALGSGGRSLLTLPLFSDAMDIFTGNENGANFLFRALGDGLYYEEGQHHFLADMYEYARGVAAFDAGEGRFGIALGNWEGPNRLFVPNGPSAFRDIAPARLAAPGRNRNVIAADFDNDGYQELFFNNLGQPNRLFAFRGGRWVEMPPGPALEPDYMGTGAAVGDLDGDGVLELMLAHGETVAQPLTLYHVPTDHHWIRVQPLTRFGAPARGAIVRLFAGGREQVRVIDAGSGYLCQMEPVAHFGLGAVRDVERIEVQWPGGPWLSLDDPGIRKTHVVPYPGDEA